MTTPVRPALFAAFNVQSLESPNLSLAYYKLADVFEKEEKNGKTSYSIIKQRPNFLNRFVELSKPLHGHVQSFHTRKRDLERIGTGFSLTTAKRLLFGVGYSHPLEIGFSFDWTTGLPIIPGSSIKGVALSFAQQCHPDKKRKDEWWEGTGNPIFGTKDSEGKLIFLPAYPCLDGTKPFLELDVMTPHYKDYYDNPTKNPPADWYNPVPLHFLTVPAGIKYCFRLADRLNLGWKEPDSDLLKKAKQLLSSALKEQGVGAKTSVDYGYFK